MLSIFQERSRCYVNSGGVGVTGTLLADADFEMHDNELESRAGNPRWVWAPLELFWVFNPLFLGSTLLKISPSYTTYALNLEVIGLLEHAVIVKDHETERETQVWLTPRYHVPYGWVLALKGSVTVQKGSTINPFSIGIASCDRGFFHDVVCYQGPEILLLLIQYTTHRSLSKSSY